MILPSVWLACAPERDRVPDPGPSAGHPGVVVLAGGGAEGDVGDRDAWSARLYPWLWAAGDVTGDGRVTVAIVSVEAEDGWLSTYLESLGVDEAFDVRVADRGAAEDEALADTFATVDAVFLKGGDQGRYHDAWNDTVLETQLRLVHQTRGGGIGGTSAGAMSLGEHALAGGLDLVTPDVLGDAETPWLRDESDGGSGVHDDFLGFVPGVVVDTHFTQRARLGRLVGTMAEAWDRSGLSAVVGLGCEEETGVRIRDGVATVVGVGTVSVVTADGTTSPRRAPGVPLEWEDLRLDRLTDGWSFALPTGVVDTARPPTGAEVVSWDGSGTASAAAWAADGHALRHEERFAWVVERDPRPYGEHAGADLPVLTDALGVTDAFATDRRAAAEEALFRGLHDHPGATGFVLGAGARAERDPQRTEVVRLVGAPGRPPLATLLVDTSPVTWRSLSPTPAPSDLGDGSLHAAGLVGARVHVLYTPASGRAWDPVARRVVPAP